MKITKKLFECIPPPPSSLLGLLFIYLLFIASVVNRLFSDFPLSFRFLITMLMNI